LDKQYKDGKKKLDQKSKKSKKENKKVSLAAKELFMTKSKKQKKHVHKHKK
jgi:hypothetical protein